MITEDDLQPLLNAVSSFQPTCNRYRSAVEPEMVGHDFLLWLAAHIVERAVAGDFTEVSAMFAAAEQLYRTGDEEMATKLTVGLLEDLIHMAEDKGVSVDALARYISGDEVRRNWNAAYAYIHPRQKIE